MGHDTPGRVILFDLDGCILDSTEPILQCLNAALVEFELGSLSRYDLSRYVGPPLQHTLTSLLEEREADPSLMQPLLDTYRSYYRTASIELAATYPGVLDAVRTIVGNERVGVCTSKPTRWGIPILEHLGLLEWFEVVAGPELTEAETKIDTMGRALDELAPVDRATSVMIGDRYHDIEAAIHHGLIPVGVTWGFGSRDELEQAGAAQVIDHPSELVGLVEAARHA